MEDKTNDENLDLLFTGAIDPADSEPSEKFWRRASEEVLKRENSGYKRKLFAWKAVAVFFGTVVVLLSAYAFYVHSKVSSIEQRISVIEKQQTIKNTQGENKQTGEANTATIVSINNEPKTTGNIQYDNSSTLATNNSTGVSINCPGNKVLANKAYTNANINTNIGTGKLTGPSAKDDIILQNNSNISSEPQNSFGLEKNLSMVPPLVDTAGDALSARGSTLTHPAGKDTSVTIKPDSSAVAVNNIAKQDVAGNPAKPPKTKDTRTLKERIYISAFFSPKIEDDFLRGDDKSSQTTSEDVKTRETDQFSFSTGLRLGYDVSRHWSVFTGFYYHGSSFSIKPVLIGAQQQENGQLGYSITTSSGVVELTDNDLQPKAGDSIRASVQSSRNYISIPLHLRYDFTSIHRLGFYVTGGVAINFAYNNTTEIHWENTKLQEGDILIRTIPDLNNVQYTYTLAGGVNYLILKRLSVFVEPGFQGSFAAINKTAPIKAYLLLFGLSAGVTYHF